jgi:hypothetical protein
VLGALEAINERREVGREQLDGGGGPEGHNHRFQLVSPIESFKALWRYLATPLTFYIVERQAAQLQAGAT